MRNSLASLTAGEGINSEIVDCILQHIVVQKPSYYAMSYLWSSNWSWLKKTQTADNLWPFDLAGSNILAPVLLIGPTFLLNHWVLLHADFDQSFMEIWDPVDGHEMEKEEQMREFHSLLQHQAGLQNLEILPFDEWHICFRRGIAKQREQGDCGVFLIASAYRLVNKSPNIGSSQSSCSPCRRQMN